ncbi:hypothetical protein ACQ4PT_032234 [Festuca glaucescens]
MAQALEVLVALEVLQTVMEKTEMQLTRPSLAPVWFQEVRQAACIIMDMVDELQDTSPPAATMMTRMLPRLAIKKNDMANKVEEMKEKVIGLKKTFQSYIYEGPVLIQHQQPRRAGDKPRSMLLFEPLVLGRGSDKQTIVNMLLSAVSNITQGRPRGIILPIFGFATSGMTTMAMMVFSDTHSFIQQYDFRVWVTVSMEFDFYRIGGSILCQVVSGREEQEDINDHDSNSDVVGMDGIMNGNHGLLNGKKVLLVLDDLWEEDPIQLQLLTSMLSFLGDKVDVIVTTRNQAIARQICTVEPYMLNLLDDDTCWEIIKESICFHVEEEKEAAEWLEKIGWEVARKCRGSPLAARVFAGQLSSHSPKYWIQHLNTNEAFNLFPSEILASRMALSYNRMPPKLRLCFAYCAIFPDGHNFLKIDLIHQWIALHLIQPSESLSATQIAKEYVTKLFDMSFLQAAKSDPASGKDEKSAILCTMHHLVWGFADCYLDDVQYRLLTDYSGELATDHVDNIRALRCVGCSKLEFKDDSFSLMRHLDILELKESPVQKLPNSIWQLRHLGYLKISEFSALVTLPESLGHLINVFHIDLSGCSGLVNLSESFGKLTRLVHASLSGCSGLVNLPESFGELIRLVHANLSGCSGLVSLPESFGKLTRLVDANFSGCSRLVNLPKSLGKLLNLVHINFSGCNGLVTLPESFGDLVNLSHVDLSRCHRLSEILEGLQKLDKLVYLNLSFWSCFQGLEKCLGSLTNLEHLNLSNPCCYLAQHRSHLQGLKDAMGQLTKLRYLNLSMFLDPIFYYHQSHEDSVQFIGHCVRGLSSLEHLDLSHNKFLFHLPESLGDLKKLHTLDLLGCIRLKRLAKRIGEISSLKLIVLNNCRGLESCQFVVHVDDRQYNKSNLVQLEVVDCKELEISCLEKAKYMEEAQRIRLVEKQKIKTLKLRWSVDAAQGSVKVDENALLGELVPPHSLQCLELHGYGGETCQPGWWVPSISSHLPNLVEVTMEDFPRCTILPPLGLLPNLKRLVLRRMASITRIDDIDLSGSDQAALIRVSKVTIDDMENLKVFLFPGVAELVIQKCPELSFGPLPPKAQKMVISGCNKVMSSWRKRQGDGEEGPSSSTPVTELVVENCNLPLGVSSLLHHLPGLCSLTLKNCDNLITSSAEINQAPSSLQSLCFSHCEEMISLPEYLDDLSSLQELTIQSCHRMEFSLQSMSKLTKLKDLYILDCLELKRWCESKENEVKLAHIRPKYE